MQRSVGASVLVVDDDASTRSLFRTILEGAGFECVEAGDAAAALSLLDAVDVVLCDARLGDSGVDGLHLAKDILSGASSVGVVMVTGVDDPELADTALELGAYGYLVKPVRRSELLLHVTNALRRRELEIGQRELVADLETRVVARTSELRAALTRAAQAELVRSQFVQNVSHELRTPLTVILAGAGLIARTTDRERLESIATSIEGQGRRLLLLIERLLEVASLDENPPSAPLEPIELRGLLALVADPARALGRNVEISVPSGAPPLVGSQPRLVSALSHLIDNAVKFTPQTCRLELSASLDSGAGAWTISVVDDGPGIPSEIHERMWEPFVQADGSAVREKGGLGVGLYLCRRLVEWHGGSVWSEETPGGGLTVVVRLPTTAPE